MESSQSHQLLNRDDQLGLVILAVTQSLLLLLLHKSLSNEFWPATQLTWLHALYTVVIGLPAFLYIGAERARDRWNIPAALGLGIALFIIGWHAGWLVEPFQDAGAYGNASHMLSLCFGLAVGIFLLALYFRTWRQGPGQPLAYSALLENSWLNALTLAFLGLFIGVFWLLLTLWAQLFDVMGIGFFEDLFELPEFAYPVTGLVGGFGLVLIRSRIRLIATVRGLCETLIRALLPLVAAILLLFLAILPVTGIAPLWDGGPGSGLLVSLLAIALFFFCAEIGDAEDSRYHSALHWLVVAAIVVLPIISALAAWGLWVRVAEYGWSVDRLWALFIELFLAAYAFGYSVLILRHRGLHLPSIRRWNTVLGITLAGALLLVQGPVIDFRRIAANDQADRLLEGNTSIAEFDYAYLAFKLGRYGINTLNDLKTHPDLVDNTDFQAHADKALAADNYWYARREKPELVERVRFITPAWASPPPDTLKQQFAEESNWYAQQCLDETSRCIALPITLGNSTLWYIYGNTTNAFSQLYAQGSQGKEAKWYTAGSVDIRRLVGKSNDDPDAELERIDSIVPLYRYNGWLFAIHPNLRFLEHAGLLPDSVENP
jgi:hypothetical protein